MSRRARAWVLAVAALAGSAYALIAPPFEVPDEVFHFWRSLIIATGQLMPQRRGEPDAGMIPLGAQNLVYVMSQTRDGKYTREQMRVAAQAPPELARPKLVRLPSWYTPLPYLPQSVAALAMHLLELRPFVVFYFGRLLNLAAALALFWLAMRAAPELAPAIAAAMLLPMTLAQLASWSADAMTIALAALLTALLLGERAPRAAIAVALLLGLCKPAYLLLSLLALATRYRPRVKAGVIGACAAGTALALLYARMGGYNQRMNDPVDAGAQLRCLAADPTRFVRAVAADVHAHGWLYIEQLVGRFGGVVQVTVPVAVVVLEIALLLGVALTGRAKARVLSAAIVAGSIVAVFLAQFVIWSVACGDVVEGVQGRYFLPLVPLALTLPALPRAPRRLPIGAIVAVGVAANAVALLRIARHFW